MLRQIPNVPKNNFNTHFFVTVHLILSYLIRWSLHPCVASLVSFHLFTGYWSKEFITRPRSKFHAQGHLQSEGLFLYTTILIFLTRFGNDRRWSFSSIFLRVVDLLYLFYPIMSLCFVKYEHASTLTMYSHLLLSCCRDNIMKFILEIREYIHLILHSTCISGRESFHYGLHIIWPLPWRKYVLYEENM